MSNWEYFSVHVKGTSRMASVHFVPTLHCIPGFFGSYVWQRNFNLLCFDSCDVWKFVLQKYYKTIKLLSQTNKSHSRASRIKCWQRSQLTNGFITNSLYRDQYRSNAKVLVQVQLKLQRENLYTILSMPDQVLLKFCVGTLSWTILVKNITIICTL